MSTDRANRSYESILPSLTIKLDFLTIDHQLVADYQLLQRTLIPHTTDKQSPSGVIGISCATYYALATTAEC